MNFQINLLTSATFLTAAMNLSLACIIFKYKQNRTHLIWACFNLVVGLWASCVLLAISSSSSLTAYRFWLFAHGFGAYVSIFFFHFACLYSRRKYKFLIIISYLYAVCMNLAYILTNGKILYNGVNLLFNGVYYLDADVIKFFIGKSFWFFLCIYGLVILYNEFNKHAHKKREARILVSAIMIGYIGGVSTFLPMLGMSNFYPATIILTAFFPIILTYGAFKHQIAELPVIYNKSFVYSSLIASISLTYLVIVLIFEKILQNYIKYQSLTVSLFTALAIGLFFIPLRNLLQKVADNLFHIDSPIVMAEENVMLRREVADKEKFKAVATLASGLAHEIKNPLSSIKTFFQQYELKKDDPNFKDNFTKIAHKEVDRIENLVKELLDFAKPKPPAFEPYSIQKVINHTLDLLENQIKKNNITLEKLLPVDDIILNIDPAQIQQALLNIFMNAIEAMGSGGTLTVRASSFVSRSSSVPRDNERATNHDPRAAELVIEDSGIGINPQHLPHIFEPFYSNKSGGTGLGLAITKGIIEGHNGTIKIVNGNVSGAKVILTFINKHEL